MARNDTRTSAPNVFGKPGITYPYGDLAYPQIVEQRAAGNNTALKKLLTPHDRYPNALLTATGNDPGDNTDANVKEKYETFLGTPPAGPWLPVTRWSEDLGPIAGRRRTVLNTGQIPILNPTGKQTYEARDLSDVVSWEIQENWSDGSGSNASNPTFPVTISVVYDNDRGSVQTVSQLVFPTGAETASLTTAANAVQSAAITAAGSGYLTAAGGTGTFMPTISGGTGTGAVLSAVVNGGAVTGLFVTAPGSGYNGSETISFAPGGGTGATGALHIAALMAVHTDYKPFDQFHEKREVETWALPAEVLASVPEIDRDGVKITVTKTLQLGTAIVEGETLNGGVWTRTTSEPYSKTIRVQVTRARPVPAPAGLTSATVTTAGSGYQTTDIIPLSASVGGSLVPLTMTLASYMIVVSISGSPYGTGWTVGDTITCTVASGTPPVITITGVSGGGWTTASITTPGSFVPLASPVWSTNHTGTFTGWGISSPIYGIATAAILDAGTWTAGSHAGISQSSAPASGGAGAVFTLTATAFRIVETSDPDEDGTKLQVIKAFNTRQAFDAINPLETNDGTTWTRISFEPESDLVGWIATKTRPSVGNVLAGGMTGTYGLETTSKQHNIAGTAPDSGYGVKESRVTPIGNTESIKETTSYPSDLATFALFETDVEELTGITIGTERRVIVPGANLGGVSPSTGIAYVLMSSGGAGYPANTTCSISGSGSGAAGFPVVSGGVIVGVAITNAGTGYSGTPTISFTGSGGSGAAGTVYIGKRYSVVKAFDKWHSFLLTSYLVQSSMPASFSYQTTVNLQTAIDTYAHDDLVASSGIQEAYGVTVTKTAAPRGPVLCNVTEKYSTLAGFSSAISGIGSMRLVTSGSTVVVYSGTLAVTAFDADFSGHCQTFSVTRPVDDTITGTVVAVRVERLRFDVLKITIIATP